MQLEMAQQYNRSPRGYPPLLQWARDHVQRLHAPPAGHEMLVTLGGNHGAEVGPMRAPNVFPHGILLSAWTHDTGRTVHDPFLCSIAMLGAEACLKLVYGRCMTLPAPTTGEGRDW